jgi:hypothetical protein
MTPPSTSFLPADGVPALLLTSRLDRDRELLEDAHVDHWAMASGALR